MVVKDSPQPPNLVPRPLSQAANNPPYPISPTEERAPGQDLFPPTRQAPVPGENVANRPATPGGPAPKPSQQDDLNKSDSESDHEWDSDGWDDVETDGNDRLASAKDIPEPLRVRSPSSASTRPSTDGASGLPAALRIGPADGVLRKSQENISQPPFESGSVGSNGMPLQSHNPYLKYQSTGQSTHSQGSIPNGSTTGSVSTNPFAPHPNAVELPSNTARSPAKELSHLSLQGGTMDNPWSTGTPPAPLSAANTGGAAKPPAPQDAAPWTTPASQRPPDWNTAMNSSAMDAFEARNYQADLGGGDQAWEQVEQENHQIAADSAAERAKQTQQESGVIDAWQSNPNAFAGSDAPPQLVAPQSNAQAEQPPALPPRHIAPPAIDTSAAASSARRPAKVETPGTKNQRQRKEHYSIKHIRWYDAKKQGIRNAPILTQNANGPCPLLALVNALVLSSPHSTEIPLLEALRTREQISLGLLLDHVIDELMSDRRAGASQQLPDVGDLYSFLINLHTGMTVNPMFIKDTSATIPGTSIVAAGSFESTRELRLYSTFNIPLIHGWLPPSESRAYAAFERSAKTYDDAQSMQFHEEELEVKLSSQGLSKEEQRLFEDLHSIKDFLTTWPTQLTDFGLTVVSRNLKPGETAIFFRNDHFSTLYKEPRSGQLFTLVTDAGYSRHEEIVWESLVDVNGQGCELFSGDFRPVGNMSSAQNNTQPSQQRPIRSLLDVDDTQDGWTTVQGRNIQSQNQSTTTAAATQDSTTNATAPPPSSTEQEDHDLALALQLQEEEEDRHRREVTERQRRENELSETYISSSSPNASSATNNRPARTQQEIRPLIPPRTNQNQGARQSAPPTHRPGNTEGDAPPPTYEQASQSPAWSGPTSGPVQQGRPARPVASNASAYGSQSMAGGSMAGNSMGVGGGGGGLGGGGLGGRHGRRHSGLGHGTASTSDKEKCVVM